MKIKLYSAKIFAYVWEFVAKCSRKTYSFFPRAQWSGQFVFSNYDPHKAAYTKSCTDCNINVTIYKKENMNIYIHIMRKKYSITPKK